MPEGDSLHRAAERLRVLEGEVVSVEAPHPRASALGIAERLSGRKLERVEAVGKNLLLSFEDGLVLRSNLRMRGRWHVRRAGTARTGRPWLVLRGGAAEAVLWNGPVLELMQERAGCLRPLGPRGEWARQPPLLRHLGPDIMRDPPELDAMVRRFRATDQGRELGDALLDQRLVAGIGNIWRAEGLFLARLPPWLRLADVSDDELRRVLEATSHAMRSGHGPRTVYRRTGLPCRRCGSPIAARRQGEDARTAYWCPGCQPPPTEM